MHPRQHSGPGSKSIVLACHTFFEWIQIRPQRPVSHSRLLRRRIRKAAVPVAAALCQRPLGECVYHVSTTVPGWALSAVKVFMLEINQLRCFVAVAEELHFSRAAERLHMTQPPLSRQIQLLEHSIGLPLFVRSNRMVRLTPAGRNLLPEARSILRLAEQARNSALRVGLGEEGRVVIGFTAVAGYQFLPDMLVGLRKALPGIDLQLRELVTAWQLEALEQGHLDLGLLRPSSRGEGLQDRCVASESLVAAIPVEHPLAKLRSLHLNDFNDQAMVMYSPDEARYFHDLVRQIFHAQQVFPRYEQHVGQVHSVLALVRSGFGAALVPESASRLHYEGLVYRRVGGLAPAKPVELHMLWRHDNDNPALARVLTHLDRQHRARREGR